MPRKLLVLFISLAFGLFLSELLLRHLFLNPKPFVWPPHLHMVFKPTPGILPGVTGDAHFITNSKGIRADEPVPNSYQILAVGGSTTECSYLDQAEAWPYQLQLGLQEKGYKVWVGNAGVSGHSTKIHRAKLPHLFAQHPSLDAVLMLIGGNDFLYYLAHLDSQPSVVPFYKKTGFWNFGRFLKQRLDPRQKILVHNYNTGESHVEWRGKRQSAAIISKLPNLEMGISEYQKNINYIADLAQQNSIRIIFMTQPTIWRPDLLPAERSLLWMGWKKHLNSGYYYSVEALAEGMKQYNDALLEICEQRKLECIDLADKLPKNTNVFYDDLHLNEAGSARVAEIVKNYLLKSKLALNVVD